MKGASIFRIKFKHLLHQTGEAAATPARLDPTEKRQRLGADLDTQIRINFSRFIRPPPGPTLDRQTIDTDIPSLGRRQMKGAHM